MPYGDRGTDMGRGVVISERRAIRKRRGQIVIVMNESKFMSWVPSFLSIVFCFGRFFCLHGLFCSSFCYEHLFDLLTSITRFEKTFRSQR